MACLFDCGKFFLANKFNHEGLECAKQLVSTARKAGDSVWLRKGLMLQGVFCGFLGDCGEAVALLSSAWSLVREQDDPAGEASVIGNMGLTLNYAGLYREAIPCFLRVIEEGRKRSEYATYGTAALCNLAQSQLSLGEYQEGLSSISQCLEQSDEPTDALSAFSRVVREYTYVQLSLELGKVSAARSHAQKCHHYALRSGARRAEYLATLALGLCEIHGGDVGKGLSILEAAVERPDDVGSVDHVDAIEALVKAYDHASQPEKALAQMTALIKTIRDRRERSIGVLISSKHGPTDSNPVFASEDADLRTLAVRHAQLRAQVAEREALTSRIEMLERFAVTADLKEEASGEHGYRVGRLALLLAEQLGWTREVADSIDLAARLHDIGKIAVPDRILLTSKELQEAERHFISTHTVIGAELLAKSNIPQLRMAEEIARHHHEWWNGEGYPSKLRGKRIPIHARIVALADVFDALTHGRPFSDPWPMDKALEEIRARKGTQFDPELTDLFLDLIAKLRTEHEDLDEYLGRAGRNSPFLQARNKIRLMLAEERENEKSATVAGNQTRH